MPGGVGFPGVPGPTVSKGYHHLVIPHPGHSWVKSSKCIPVYLSLIRTRDMGKGMGHGWEQHGKRCKKAQGLIQNFVAHYPKEGCKSHNPASVF